MEPEIARRCHDCGATVRSGSLYCPQCGKPLKKADAAGATSTAEAPENIARRITDPGRSAPTIDSPQSVPLSIAPISSQAGESRHRAEVLETRAGESNDGGVTSKRQRVTAAARDVVEEKLSPRVEKLRHASNVMLEEAAYDPSLRFVLVAIVILLLSLFLLLLNYLLG
jgi:uncharacterized Zn finger protein (UPF0148 family)